MTEACAQITCDRCGEAKKTVAFRAYDGWGHLLCLDCRLAINRYLYDGKRSEA